MKAPAQSGSESSPNRFSYPLEKVRSKGRLTETLLLVGWLVEIQPIETQQHALTWVINIYVNTVY